MCGIAGYFLKATVGQDGRAFLDALIKPIRQRGPDDEGVCLINRPKDAVRSFRTDQTTATSLNLPHIKDDHHFLPHDAALIHTRYAIIDLSVGGHQPFVSQDGSIIAVFNGEIYNYLELREDLIAKGVGFRTSSDTEVLIEGYCVWGEDLWAKMNGFWAVALYDFKNNSIVFSRDRIGVAPLYYRETHDGFFFSSSIQPLIDIDPGGIDLNTDAILGFSQTGIKDNDNTTFYSQIKSLPSSSTVIFPEGCYKLSESTRKEYWDFPKSRLSIDDISFNEAVEKYRETFFNSVALRLRADVKVAFELSGGLDSSSVVAAAAILRENDVTTYTIKVPESDEEPYARAILDYYPVDYHVLNGLEKTFSKELYKFSEVMEEPYHSPNIYTHYQMRCKMKKEGVSVVVMGAGGDEDLGGYESSFWPMAYHELKKNGFIWHADLYEFCRRFMTFEEAKKTFRHYIFDLPGYLGNRFKDQGNPSSKQTESRALFLQSRYRNLSFHEQSLYHFKVALIPYYMRSNDHFTMAIPIEHRFPLLDYRIVEFSLQLPIPYLYKNGWTKYILRKAMEPYLPKKIIWRRKKMGFPFPYHQFLSNKRQLFKPLFKSLRAIEFPIDEFESYEKLLSTNSVLLWRLVSTAIWANHNLKFGRLS